MHKEIQLKHFATNTIVHNQSEKRYLDFSTVSHIYRNLFYVFSKRSMTSFLSLNDSKSKHYLSKELETDLVLWLTSCDISIRHSNQLRINSRTGRSLGKGKTSNSKKCIVLN